VTRFTGPALAPTLPVGNIFWQMTVGPVVLVPSAPGRLIPAAEQADEQPNQ
jgi:hypothetical protein